MHWLARENYAVGDLKQRYRGTQQAEWTEARQENGHPARGWQATRKVWWAVKHSVTLSIRRITRQERCYLGRTYDINCTTVGIIGYAEVSDCIPMVQSGVF